jgi:hypothetical protein
MLVFHFTKLSFFLLLCRRLKFPIIKVNVIPATARGAPYDCETSRSPHFLDNRLTDDGEVVSLTRRPAALYSQEDSWYSFLLEAESTPRP